MIESGYGRSMPGVDVVAEGLSVRGPRGAVFENVCTEVEAGGVLLVRGPAGSGRTSLLLALAGRMRFVSGAVRVGEHVLPDDFAAVREAAALARVEPAHSLEERLRVDDLIAERRWIDRVGSPEISRAFDLVGLEMPGKALIEDLDAAAVVLLELALAMARQPGALVVDDPEKGCSPGERTRVLDGLDRVRATGTTLLLSTADSGQPFPDAASVVLPQRSAERLSRTARK